MGEMMERGMSELEMDKSNLDFVHAMVFESDQFTGDGIQNKRDVWEEIEFEHPEIPTNYESFITLLLMPIIIYGGFGRSVVISEKRSNTILFAHVQELLLHSLPLGLLLIFNAYTLDKFTKTEWVSIGILICNIVEVVVEITLLNFFENTKVNLELKRPMKS